MAEDVILEMGHSGECGTTVGLLTDEGAETQVNLIHVLFQISSLCAGMTTRDTLEGLLLEVDIAVMLQHISPFEEAFATLCTCRP